MQKQTIQSMALIEQGAKLQADLLKEFGDLNQIIMAHALAEAAN